MGESSFILKESEYDRVPVVLFEVVQGFADSVEIDRLSDEERRLPGVVAAALSKFLVRFQEEEAREGGLSPRDAKTLEDAYRVVERLAASKDQSIQNLVVSEIFENLRCKQSVLDTIKARLGPRSQSLYARWLC